jgi:antitoxin component YwqK of YwqJK toxin-antitoxin module
MLFFISLQTNANEKQSINPDTLLNQTDNKGLKQGFWRVAYENGKTKYEATFKDNKPVGEMKRYYEDGTIKAIMIFDNTGKKSRAKLFYTNGILATEGNFIESMKDSIWKYYSYYDTILKMEESYVNGIKNGVTKKYYSNKKIAEILEFKNGLKNGSWKEYFDNGTLKLEANYVNDKRDGEFETFYSTGKPEMKGFFKNNFKEKEWKYFDEDGNIKMTINYVNNIPQNPETLDKNQEEFFKSLDSNKGKIPEPDETNIIPEK